MAASIQVRPSRIAQASWVLADCCALVAAILPSGRAAEIQHILYGLGVAARRIARTDSSAAAKRLP